MRMEGRKHVFQGRAYWRIQEEAGKVIWAVDTVASGWWGGGAAQPPRYDNAETTPDHRPHD